MREKRKFATTSTVLTGRVIASIADAICGENPAYGGNWILRDAPEWKHTGTSSSWHVAHTGSYAGSLMCGTSRNSIGTEGMTTPRWHLPTARLISLTVASIGDSVTMHWGMKRGLVVAHSSIRKSLYACTQASSSPGSSRR